MDSNPRDNEPIDDFDETNGKVPGLEGDDSGSVDSDEGSDNIFVDAAERLLDRDGREEGDTDEDADPAVTPYSEDR